MPPGLELGASHALICGLRDRSSETELTRTLARVFIAEPWLASQFVEAVLKCGKRGRRQEWDSLPPELRCLAETAVEQGRVDLEFRDDAGLWRVFVEIKVGAGFGPRQLERYLVSLQPGDPRHVLAAITRDVPRYGDLPLSASPNWIGSISWAQLLASLREFRVRDSRLRDQWPLFLDVLEAEGSFGLTRIDEELLQTWAHTGPARDHAVAFVESLRSPLLEALREALAEDTPPDLRETVAGYAGKAARVRTRQIDADFTVPAAGKHLISAGFWAWDDFRWQAAAVYPSQAPAGIVEELQKHGFVDWEQKWLWKSIPLSSDVVRDPELRIRLLDWTRDAFGEIARSGVLEHLTGGDAATAIA